MGTHSRIRMVLPSGEAKSIYCHWDGYPEHHLPILNKYYNTDEKVRELLNLGAISVLAPRVKPNKDEVHTFDNPIKDVVIAYLRDRGDEMMRGHSSPEEYDYLWNGEKWTVKT